MRRSVARPRDWEDRPEEDLHPESVDRPWEWEDRPEEDLRSEWEGHREAPQILNRPHRTRCRESNPRTFGKPLKNHSGRRAAKRMDRTREILYTRRFHEDINI